jgi:natural product biosynthesis luciferase-like monooxygenase protein
MEGNVAVGESQPGEDRSAAVSCAVVGDEPLVAQCVDLAREIGLDVVLVATTNELVRDHAAERSIATVGQSDELVAGLHAHPADVLLSVANLHDIPDDALGLVSTTLHYHDGLLPAYAGLNVTSWAILNGEREHGITWYVVPSHDAVSTVRFPLADDETAFSLNARCYESALASLPDILSAIANGDLHAEPHVAGELRTYTSHDRPALLLDPERPAAETVRMVRALDVGHRLRNTVGSVRWIVGNEVVVVDAADTEPGSGTPGELLGVDGGARIATVDGTLVIRRVSSPEGAPEDVAALLGRQGLTTGDRVPSPSGQLTAMIREREPALVDDEDFWLDRLADVEPTAAPVGAAGAGGRTSASAALPDGTSDADAVAVVALWLSRMTGAERVAFAVTSPDQREVLRHTAPLTVPGIVVIDVSASSPFEQIRAAAGEEVAAAAERQPLLRDAVGRDPRTRGRASAPNVVVALGSTDVDPPVPLATINIAVGDGRLVAHVDGDHEHAAARVVEQLAALMSGVGRDPTARAGDLPLIGPDEQAALDALNRTELDYDRSATIDALFRAQVARTPDAPALSWGARTLSYTSLASEVAALAARLAAAGVGRADRVGVAVPRGIEMVVGVLATLELGAAYVPLDPTYPMDRLGFMVDDSGIKVLLTTQATGEELHRPTLTVLDPAERASDEGAATADRAAGAHDASDLAYVIYTSGSTGLPKGVMLEHRQVTNFFVAMDQVIDHDPPGVWLSVTSLSFDISVLELLWTLTRGFHVVLKADRGVPAATGTTTPARAAPTGPLRPVSFSLFYFAAGEEAAADGYRLLLESARVADRNGFEAVWTPERHFHAFGGAYPNPSVTGAALAAITEHVGIRAGSVVLPLHSPLRVAEEWSVVDNISRGRVAISFAAGWQPNDFVLNPGAFATAKDDLARNIDVVRRLWRGESVTLPGHDGRPVDVRTLPRPVQPSLPVWLTSAGSPATFERAGTLGVNVLTHLLGQSIEQLAENVARYRTAWRAAGHAGDGQVTLMLHTYLDRDADTAREVAREPMKGYLGTAVGLLRDFATAFPIFAKSGQGSDDIFKTLSPEELDQLLEMAAHRYLSTSGLFGTADDAAAIIEAVSAVGVDEVACLIDFGIDTDAVLSSLDLLLAAKTTVDQSRADVVVADATTLVDDSVAGLTTRHGITHLQCTPSLAAMLVADPADRAALGSIGHLMVGGEALPTALAAELRTLLPGRFTNMYGPTETTIWSLTHEITGAPEGPVPIGRPIANTTVFVLDPAGNRLPTGAFGELHIGGEGLARGYHDRPELTAERFVDRPGMGRVYATGDIVRVHPLGHVEFAGRSDNQVKIRGHRIELGEIEALLDRHDDVVQSVVVAREDRGDTRLVAFVVMHHGATADGDALRKYVAASLPDAMVPSSIVPLDRFPLTPNGKIDRKELPDDVAAATTAPVAAQPAGGDEQLVADVWTAELGRAVGRDDNFFDIGGHSLLAVKVFRQLTEASGVPLALTDVFRFPTVRTFAAHLAAMRDGNGGAASATPSNASAGTDRGAMRRRALTRRLRTSQDDEPS